jgi:tetratricopeptide (TPR) repeat protein
MDGELSLKFSRTESFMLFAEGLRSLQLYRDDGQASDLSDARQSFQKCARRYPSDALPLYYLGIVLSLQGEDDPQQTQNAAEAARIFDHVATSGPSSMRPNAKFNRDVVLAQTGTVLPNDIVRDQAPPEHLSPFLQELKSWLSRALPGTYLVNSKPTKSDEDEALKLQSSILSVHTKVRRLGAQPDSQSVKDIETRLDRIKQELDRAQLAKRARIDMTTDYWNTLGLLKLAVGDFSAAEGCFISSLTLKPDWLPAKRNLVKTLEAAGKHSDADSLKAQIQAAENPPEHPQGLSEQDTEVIADLIVKSAPQDNPIAIANLITTSFGPIPQAAFRGIAGSVAGKANAELVTQILKALPSTGS